MSTTLVESPITRAVDFHRGSQNPPDEMICCNEQESVCGLDLAGTQWMDVEVDETRLCSVCISVFLTEGWRCRFCGCNRFEFCDRHPDHRA